MRSAFRGYGGRVVYIDHHPLSVDLPGVEVVHEVDMEPRKLLVHVLRELWYKSVRVGCDTATCGACT